jgi:hypothetical protein
MSSKAACLKVVIPESNSAAKHSLFVGGKISHGELQIDQGGQLRGTVECIRKRN